MANGMAIAALLIFIAMDAINGQSFGTVPATLARIESELEEVHDTSTQMADTTNHITEVLDAQTKQLDSITQQQNDQDQILTTMGGILQNQDKNMSVISEQMNLQNQILLTMTALLQKQDQQLENMVHGLQSLGKSQFIQTQVLNSVASSLQNISESLTAFVKIQQDTTVPNLAETTQPPTEKSTLMQTMGPTTDWLIEQSDPGAEFIAPVASDCYGYMDQCLTDNYGVYEIQPSCTSHPFNVVCDLDTHPGGWIVFQRRFDGSVDFYRDWNQYKLGFGDLHGEFWLGLEKIYNITRRDTWELRIELEDHYRHRRYAEYANFAVGSEGTNYRLTFGEYSGNAGDSLRFHESMAFSTYDRDHDTDGTNCAMAKHGAWWYSNCLESNLNGRFYDYQRSSTSGMIWWHWIQNYGVKKTEMKIRRIQ